MIIALAAVALVQTAPAPAPAPPPARRVSDALAREAVETALSTCRAMNAKVGVAVVDAGGNAIFSMTPEGAAGRSGDVAARKAITVTLTGKPSSRDDPGASGPAIAADPKLDAAVKADLRRPLILKGAVPLTAGGVLFGAIGASGGTGDQDQACAKAGADRIIGRIK